jgi:hypothetical protein
MPGVAHGRPCREEEMGVGSARSAIYLRQMWSSGRRASWWFSCQKRQLAAARNCRRRFLDVHCLSVRPSLPPGVQTFLDEPSKFELRYHQKCQQRAHLSLSLLYEPTGCANVCPMAASPRRSGVRVARRLASLRSSH